ncbi:fungal-specific transcription factor domain-domain-containing protein, partial [Coniella lustricola]
MAATAPAPETSAETATTATTAASPPATPAAAALPLRSCVVCRQRKIRCDRARPCSSCSRSACECVYPSGRGRAPKRSRRDMEAQLTDKLVRMEAIIRRLASENASQATALSARPGEPPVSSSSSSHAQNKHVSSPAAPSAASVETQLSHLVVGQKKSYYVSNPLWATLAGEVSRSVARLFSPSAPSLLSPCSPDEGLNAALFGYRSIAHSLRPYHPPVPQALDMFSAFASNVAPLLRLFHMPTLSALYRDSVLSTKPLDKNTEALVFAIYYAAVVSMPSDQCMAVTGLPHQVASARYRFAVEQAMARADLLNTHSLVLLQAVVLFLSALRSHSDSRASWSLTTVIFHLAQAMGLHRDGAVFGLSPFETEIRRRLWWHICILDSRSSDHHGFGPLMYQASFDTRIPLHINDADLWPAMTEPPHERQEATDMTFALVRCEAIRVAVQARLLSPDEPSSAGGANTNKAEASHHAQLALMQTLRSRLHDHYLPYCSNTSSSPIQLFSALLIKLILVHFRLMIFYPLRRPGVLTRDELFLASVEILELCHQLLTLPAMRNWSWYARSHVQWHVVAFVLLEICSRPPSPMCERAWTCAAVMCSTWSAQSYHVTQGLMWKSVQRLLARAKYVRELQ